MSKAPSIPQHKAGGFPGASHKLLLILDIDETLVHATENPLSQEADFRIFDYFVYKRPYLKKFLIEVSDLFDLAVWSSAGENYVREIISRIFPKPDLLKFIWSRNKCTVKYQYDDYNQESKIVYIKNLKKVKRAGFDLNRVLILDDSPEKIQKNYGNHIMIPPFFGKKNDIKLIIILPFLKWIDAFEDVRAIEKRGWRIPNQDEVSAK